jgi:hypothetical protein
MILKIKNYLMGAIGFYSTFFILIWMIAWILNGYHGYKFDLKTLQDFYMFVLSQLNITHGINSIFNSNKGEMPK